MHLMEELINETHNKYPIMHAFKGAFAFLINIIKKIETSKENIAFHVGYLKK